MKPVFRKAEVKDAERIAEIYEAIHDESEAGRASIGWQRGVYPTIATARGAIEVSEMYVAELAGKIVAAGILNGNQLDVYRECHWKYEALEEEVLVLHTLVLDPAESGKGIASAFVGSYEEVAREQGCKVLRIDTQEKNQAARRLYAKLGFEEPEILDCEFNGIPGVRLVLLEKPVV